MSKTILILYSGDDWNQEHPSHKGAYKESYAAWGKVTANQGNILTRASINWFNQGSFKKYWTFDSNLDQWIKKEENLVPDVVYDKAKMQDDTTGELLFDIYTKKLEISGKIKFINHPTTSMLLDNKVNQMIAFGKFLPSSKLQTIDTNIQNPDEKYYVLKKAYGSGGSNVKVLNDKIISVEKDTIVQEFIDAKDSEGLIKDYRFVFIGDKLAYCASRIAAGDSKLTNVSKGADSVLLKVENIDKNLLQTVTEVTKQLQFIDKLVFSLDFMVETATSKAYLIEYNSSPGVAIITNDKDTMINYYTTLNNYLLD